MKSTENRIDELHLQDKILEEKIALARFELNEMQEFVWKLEEKKSKVWNRLMKLLSLSIQRTLRSAE